MDVKAGHGWGAWLPWDLQVATMVCSRIFSPVQSGYPPSSTSTPLTFITFYLTCYRLEVAILLRVASKMVAKCCFVITGLRNLVILFELCWQSDVVFVVCWTLFNWLVL